MRITKCLLGMVVLPLAFAAMAPAAMAVTPEGDPAGGKFPVPATATSGESKLSTTSGLTLACSSGSGSGQANSKTTGEGSYILHGCKESTFGSFCNTAGQPSGTIKLETVTLDLVYLDENHTIPGVLATPPASGVFAKLLCAGGLVTFEIKGNGVLGRITSPSCGQTSKVATVKSETTAHGKFKYTQVEETGTVYGLTANGVSAATDWTVTGTSIENGTLTCPEQK